MKKLFVLFLFLSATLYTQAQVTASTPLDTIVRLGGKKIIANVNQVSQSTIYYRFPSDEEVYTIDRKQVERIDYNSGRVEQFNKPVLMMLDENQWEAVLVTEDKDVIDGLYEYGKVASSAASSSRSKKAARKSASIRLQKKAAAMGANIVLLTNAEAKGGYGEIPGYEMEGIAYGFNPKPEEETEEE